MEKMNNRRKRIGAGLLASVATAGIMMAAAAPASADVSTVSSGNSENTAKESALTSCHLFGYPAGTVLNIQRTTTSAGATWYVVVIRCHN